MVTETKAQAQPQTLGELAGIESPALDYLYDIVVELQPGQQIGDVGRGARVIVPVTGGQFSGPKLRGRVLNPAGDWLTIRSDGVGELDVRVTLETDDGALIYVSYRGYVTDVPTLLPRWAGGETIGDAECYFRVTPYFETSATQYAWLTKTAAIGVGRLVSGGCVAYRVFAVR